jgi:cysteine synthase A
MKTAEMASLRVAEEITELVGETPILHLRKLVPAGAGDVYAKLEYLNPGGSIKDRAALGMITKAERAGRLKPGATIFEATAGNTGVGLALIGSGRGYKTVLAVPEGFSQEKVTLMEALGAEVIRTPKDGGMQAAIDYVKERAARTPNSFIAGQFENLDNPDFHYETTGREFHDQLGGQVDAIVIGCGTGGTFSGVARYLKEKNPEILAIAVETEGSVLGGGEKGDHEVEGIGASFMPKTFDGSLADEIIAVTDRDAFDMVKKLAAIEGVLAGSSAGANVFAAIGIAKRLGAGKRVATIIPDSAERYLSKGIFQFNEKK